MDTTQRIIANSDNLSAIPVRFIDEKGVASKEPRFLFLRLDNKKHLVLSLTDRESNYKGKIRLHFEHDSSVVMNQIMKLYEVYDE